MFICSLHLVLGKDDSLQGGLEHCLWERVGKTLGLYELVICVGLSKEARAIHMLVILLICCSPCKGTSPSTQPADHPDQYKRKMSVFFFKKNHMNIMFISPVESVSFTVFQLLLF